MTSSPRIPAVAHLLLGTTAEGVRASASGGWAPDPKTACGLALVGGLIAVYRPVEAADLGLTVCLACLAATLTLDPAP